MQKLLSGFRALLDVITATTVTAKTQARLESENSQVRNSTFSYLALLFNIVCTGCVYPLDQVESLYRTCDGKFVPEVVGLSPVSYTHLTLPTIYSV